MLNNRIKKIKRKQKRMIRNNPYLFGDEDFFYDAVFLDFDGVIRINSMFDDTCIQNIISFCNKTGARIVVSSSWQFDFYYDEMISLLNKRGLSSHLIGKTGGKLLQREGRILNYLESNLFIDRFIVLDDDLSFSELSDYFVHTDGSKGFDIEKLQEAVDQFMKQPVLSIRN